MNPMPSRWFAALAWNPLFLWRLCGQRRPCRPRLAGTLALLVCATLLAAAAPARAQAQDGVPAMSKPLAPAAGDTAAAPGAPRTIGWELLMPPGWDPFKEFKEADLKILSDADPRASKMLGRMRELWDKAPINNALIGRAVRLPGFVVPLEETREGLKEFLLVPYFGACIHTPPPPANQVVHVLSKLPLQGVKSMDTVWVTGPLEAIRTDSFMGTSGYRIEASNVAPYAERAR